MDGRTDGRKAFYNLPTTAFGRREIIIQGSSVLRSCYKNLQTYTNMGKKLIISSILGFVFNILSSPTIMCADNQNTGYKVLSRDSNELVLISRYRWH